MCEKLSGNLQGSFTANQAVQETGAEAKILAQVSKRLNRIVSGNEAGQSGRKAEGCTENYYPIWLRTNDQPSILRRSDVLILP